MPDLPDLDECKEILDSIITNPSIADISALARVLRSVVYNQADILGELNRITPVDGPPTFDIHDMD